jgi:hypothetical protein
MTNLDQFYTKDDIALNCFNTLKKYTNIEEYDIILEPSAGKGAFFKLIPEHKRQGIDLEPKLEGIIKQNFFKYNYDTTKKYIVIGNPPFGKISSIAVKFFNYASQFADIIAFIIPRTFKRVSIQNQLNPNFNLIYNEDLPLKPCCFEPVMGAKCCFQIWKRNDTPRTLVKYNKTHKDFKFVKLGPLDDKKQPTPPTTADFVIKAYGSNCGEVITKDLISLRPKSWHWIKSNIDIELLKIRFKQLDYSMSKDTVRQDSLGQQELIYLYELKFGL